MSVKVKKVKLNEEFIAKWRDEQSLWVVKPKKIEV